MLRENELLEFCIKLKQALLPNQPLFCSVMNQNNSSQVLQGYLANKDRVLKILN